MFRRGFYDLKSWKFCPLDLRYNDLNRKETVKTFYEKELKKQIKKGLGLKKYSREKAINFMFNVRDIIIALIAG